jgi:hypothetical protein
MNNNAVRQIHMLSYKYHIYLALDIATFIFLQIVFVIEDINVDLTLFNSKGVLSESEFLKYNHDYPNDVMFQCFLRAI